MAEQKSFVPRITLEEYERQKMDYTQKALQELREQMKIIKPPSSTSSSNHSASNSENENTNDDFIENDQTKINSDLPNVNVIINPSSNNSNGLRKRKSINKKQKTDDETLSLTETIYIQREREMLELNKVKTINRRLEVDLNEQERKNHFLKLDLNNALLDNTNLTIKVASLAKENTRLEEQAYKDKITILLLKALLVLCIMQFIYNTIF